MTRHVYLEMKPLPIQKLPTLQKKLKRVHPPGQMEGTSLIKGYGLTGCGMQTLTSSKRSLTLPCFPWLSIAFGVLPLFLL